MPRRPASACLALHGSWGGRGRGPSLTDPRRRRPAPPHSPEQPYPTRSSSPRDLPPPFLLPPGGASTPWTAPPPWAPPWASAGTTPWPPPSGASWTWWPPTAGLSGGAASWRAWRATACGPRACTTVRAGPGAPRPGGRAAARARGEGWLPCGAAARRQAHSDAPEGVWRSLCSRICACRRPGACQNHAHSQVPAGPIGPDSRWYTGAYAAARPTSPAARRAAADLFAARWGLVCAVPRRIVALYSPRISFKLQPAAFQNFINYWQVCGGSGLAGRYCT